VKKKQGNKPLRPEEELQRVLEDLASGQLDGATRRAQRAVERWPQNPKGWLIKGVVADARGDVEKAERALARSIELNPRDAQAHNSLGVVAVRQGRLADGLAAFQRALALAPDYPQALNNLGNLRRGQGAFDEAASLYRKALALAPNYADAQVNLSIVLSKQGQPEAAEACARRAWELGVTAASAFQLGVVLKEKGDREGAIAALTAAAERDPTDGRGAGLLLSALGAAPPPAKPSEAYVRSLFDGIAEGYDAHLEADLAYRGPEIIDAALEVVIGDRAGLDILDLGCGTGLLAVALAARAERIDGVDLSPAMVALAGQRGLYTELAVGDIVSHMESLDRSYDAIIAADVLVYLGDLAPTFAAAAARLNPAGLWAFTIEHRDGAGWGVGESGRYVHSEGYLRELAAQFGFEVKLVDTVSTRQERGVPVPGLAAVLQLV